ncbi:MAG: hypothetical protein ACJ8G7_14250 [Rhizobacter sp.]
MGSLHRASPSIDGSSRRPEDQRCVDRGSMRRWPSLLTRADLQAAAASQGIGPIEQEAVWRRIRHEGLLRPWEVSMYELIRRLTLRQLALEQLPMLLLALGIAEVFYKFHSFLLESGAFLLTWLALGASYDGLKALFVRAKAGRS